MKTLRQIEDRILTAIMVVALMVPLILVAISQDNIPTLSFEGAEIRAMPDGSVQLLFDVSITTTNDTEGTTGAEFSLKFNSKYIRPSDYTTNKVIEGLMPDSSPAFQINPQMYGDWVDDNGVFVSHYPFLENQGRIFNDTITIQLYTNAKIKPDAGSVLERREVPVGEGANVEKVNHNVYDARDKWVLGTLSFRVMDPDLLPEITEKFDGLKDELFGGVSQDNKGTKLIYFDGPATLQGALQPWAIGVVFQFQGDYKFETWNDYGSDTNSNKAQATFTYNLPKTLISVTEAENKVTVDAYQAYTDGKVSDLDIVLQKYSPMVLLKYSNGEQENAIVPWSRATTDDNGLPWTASVAKLQEVDPTTKKPVDKYYTVKDAATDPDGEVKYDPTASGYQSYPWYQDRNANYVVTKDFWYHEGGKPDGEIKCFPIPVKVDLTVTPITLVDVTAENTERVYTLGDGSAIDAIKVQNVSDLALPDEARLVTDVPAGGATLTMPIRGWTHVDRARAEGVTPIYWPYSNASTDNIVRMQDLWKDKADDNGAFLHWPTDRDTSDDNGLETIEKKGPDDAGDYRGNNRAGTYTFYISDSYGGEPAPGFTRAAIQAAYPWLTVPENTEKNMPKGIELADGLTKEEVWPIGDVTRRIVWVNDHSTSPDPKKPVDKSQYRATYVSTTTIYSPKYLPRVTLQVSKWDISQTNVPTSLAMGSLFRLRLPDGTEMGIGTVGDVAVTSEDWFAANDGSYSQTSSMEYLDGATTQVRVFNLVFEPGDAAEPGYQAERERLLRYINLGGWFYVSVNEDVSNNYWSDFIPVYVPPRTNIHLEHKVYNFIGENANLYRFVNAGTEEAPVFPTTITLPAGSYEVVGDDGEPKMNNGARVTERYGVKTLYSGVTGAQPGELNTFSIEGPAWTPGTPNPDTVKGEPVKQYGPDDFKDNYPARTLNFNDPGNGAPYGAYGWVRNLGEPTAAGGYQTPLYDATIRVQRELDEPERPEDPENPDPEEMHEKIKLVYYGLPGGVTPYYDDSVPVIDRQNVSLVTFDTKVEGYTVRQEYTLTIVNVGDVDIYGLSIDLLTDLLDDPEHPEYRDEGGNFTLLKPPASYLPVGGSTNFTLSYRFNLSGGQNQFLDYLDKLYITSDSKHKVSAAPGEKLTAGVDYLLDFDAQFRVSTDPIHRVWVRYNPDTGEMGTAQVVVGSSTGIAGPVNANAGSNAAVENDRIFIMATPTDEYTVSGYTQVGSDGTNLKTTTYRMQSYTGYVTMPSGESIYVDDTTQVRVWYMTMPNQDVTVTINFTEPISSKLRLEDLLVFASEEKCAHGGEWPGTEDHMGELRDYESPTDDSLKYEVWQKEFDPQDLLDAQSWAKYPEGDYAKSDVNKAPNPEEQGRYLMTRGRAVTKGFAPSVSQYLVVIPYEAKFVQVEATIRRLAMEWVYDEFGEKEENEDLTDINVTMTWFPEEVGPYETDETKKSDPFNFNTTADGGKYQIYTGQKPGSTAVQPTVHTSRVFDAPGDGKSSYVRVRLQYTVSAENIDENRYYFVEIHRPTKEPVAELKYGNSPYGMIMNDKEITDKAAAKKAFVENRYSFAGLEDTEDGSPSPVKLIPTVVKENGLENIHYWTEAWVDVDAPYEPESGLGFEYIFDNDTNSEIGEGTLEPNPEIYIEERDNLDLNDYTLFGILGESVWEPGLINVLDSTGRPAKVDMAVLYVEAYGLDTTDGISQLERFGLPDKPGEGATEEEVEAYNKRFVTLYRHHPAGGLVENWDKDHENDDEDYLYLRPGRYTLIYIIPDYNYIDDYTTGAIPADWTPVEGKVLRVERPFVVLAPVGDVNADLVERTKGDTEETTKISYKTEEDHLLVKGRITEPLGYMAEGYANNDGAIFKFRTVDVNNDRNINNIDANTIREGKGVERFYLPVDYIYPRPEVTD